MGAIAHTGKIFDPSLSKGRIAFCRLAEIQAGGLDIPGSIF
jgi:hypothetical protein